jgi:aminopeptidase
MVQERNTLSWNQQKRRILMIDPRVAKMADVLVNYSLEIKQGDKLLIGSTPLAAPLVREVYRAALRAGGHPVVRISLAGIDEIMYSTNHGG